MAIWRRDRTLVDTTLPHFADLTHVLMDRDKPYYIDFCHLSEEGNKVIAERICEVLEAEYLAATPPGS